MKLKHFAFAATLPMMFAACSDDQYSGNQMAGQDKSGVLIDAPILGVSVGDDASTRVFDNGEWTWIPTVNGGGNVTSVDNVGLCWTGVNNDGGYEAPSSETKDMVYTNFKFEHVGWLQDGDDTPVIKCGELKNGAFHKWNAALLPQATYSGGAWSASPLTLDMGRGIFKTQNATIYAGEYIVYSPYNDKFFNAPIVAVQDRIMEFNVDANNANLLMNKYAFNLGYVRSIKGGDEATKFTTKMLSTGLHLKFTGSDTKNIKEIVLWSGAQKGFLTQQAISAKEVKTATALSTDIYLEGENWDQYNNSSSSLVVKMRDGSGDASTLAATAGKDLYIPFLPVEGGFGQLHIMLIDADGKVADIKKEVDFPAGQPRSLTLSFSGEKVYQGIVEVAEFSEVNYAYDEESFLAAYQKAATTTTATPENWKPRSIMLIDNIELTKQEVIYAALSGAGTKRNIVLINSDETLPEGVKNTITLAGNEAANVDFSFASTTFNANVKTALKGCCNNGKVNLTLTHSKTGKNTVLTVNGGDLVLSKTVTLQGNVNSLIEENEAGNIEPSVTVKDDALVTMIDGTFVNEGKMTIQKNAGKFYMNGAEMINRGDLNVEGNGNSAEDGVLRMYNATPATNKASFTNEGNIFNRGNIDNDGEAKSFTNESGATFTDYVGSTLSGYRIENKEGADFISEVNSVVRYNNAIDLAGIRPTTIVRFVYGVAVNIGSGTFTTTYTLEPNKDGGIYVPYPADGVDKLVKFESCIDNGNTLILNHATVDLQPVATSIGDLTIKSGFINQSHENLTIDGDYTVDGGTNTYLPVGIKLITGDMNLKNVAASTGNVKLDPNKEINIQGNLYATALSGALTFAKGSVVNVGKDIVIASVATGTTFEENTKVYAANMDVNASQNVVFKKNNVTYIGRKLNAGSLVDNGTGILTNNGSIEIQNAVSGSDVAAKVWCKKRQGAGTYANNSYPQYY